MSCGQFQRITCLVASSKGWHVLWPVLRDDMSCGQFQGMTCLVASFRGWYVLWPVPRDDNLYNVLWPVSYDMSCGQFQGWHVLWPVPRDDMSVASSKGWYVLWTVPRDDMSCGQFQGMTCLVANGYILRWHLFRLSVNNTCTMERNYGVLVSAHVSIVIGNEFQC